MRDRFELLRARASRLEELSAAEFARWAAARRDRVAHHHYSETVSGRYREICDRTVPNLSFGSAWTALPIIDKQFLDLGGYSHCPVWAGRTVLTSTSGSTSTAVTVPHTTASARTGLGDNFLTALARVGAASSASHWGIEHRVRGMVTGSQLSMRWLRKCLGERALVTATHVPLDVQVAAAKSFGPWSISSSPGFLARLAAHIGDADVVRPSVVLYGGAALDEGARAQIQRTFRPERIVGFYPTTDAGALGMSVRGDGIYESFAETHWIEVLDDDGTHVQVGEIGDLVVTSYDNLAAPLVRYRVGDSVRYLGIERNRVLLADIARRAEAAIGDTLLPLAEIATWTARLQAVDPTVAAVQLVRSTSEAGIDRPVIRVIVDELLPATRAAAENLVRDFPQLVHDLETGVLEPLDVEQVDPEVALEGLFKLPTYVDERRFRRVDQLRPVVEIGAAGV